MGIVPTARRERRIGISFVSLLIECVSVRTLTIIFLGEREMKKVTFMLLLAVVICSGVSIAEPTTLLSEDWESISSLPTSDWSSDSLSSSKPQILIDSGGNHYLDIGGGSIASPGQPGVVTHNSFQTSYSSGLSLSTDLFVSSGSGHASDLYFGLYGAGNDPHHERFIEMNFNKYESKFTCILQSGNSNHQDSQRFDYAYTTGIWNTAMITIRPDQYVEFYLNSSLVWTSTKTVDPVNSGIAKFSYSGYSSGGPANFDNLKIATVPAPGAMLLGMIGIGCVRKLRRHRAI